MLVFLDACVVSCFWISTLGGVAGSDGNSVFSHLKTRGAHLQCGWIILQPASSEGWHPTGDAALRHRQVCCFLLCFLLKWGLTINARLASN